ncbi:MAG: HD domain-containing phosphohydrolase [Mycobacteriales bacterium]
MEHMLRSSIIASRLAELIDLSSEQRGIVFYSDLLAWIGCQADSPEISALFGNDIDYRAATFHVDLAGLPLMRLMMSHVGDGRPALQRQMTRAGFMLSGREQMTKIIESHRVSSVHLADRLGLGSQVGNALGFTFERWDGKGLPDGASGEQIPVEMRIVHVADVIEVYLRERGVEGAVDLARKRSGTQFDPAIVSVFESAADEIFASLPTGDAWRAAIAEAPDPDERLSPGDMDALLIALADFVDLRSPYRHGHSRQVALLAATAASNYGLPADEVELVRRAGWVHDVGRLGVSSGIWNKADSLSSTERERIFLYPHLSQRILGRVPGLKEVAALAGLHRERLDGSGYPKGVDKSFLPVSARILAAADAYQSLTEARAFRPALSADAAAEHLRRDVRAGTLDGYAVEATVAAAGGDSPRTAGTPAGLTARELEILRMVGIGQSNRDIAATLGISEKTVRNHLEHIYAKAGVSNRVSASLFALQHGIIRADLA